MNLLREIKNASRHCMDLCTDNNFKKLPILVFVHLHDLGPSFWSNFPFPLGH